MDGRNFSTNYDDEEHAEYEQIDRNKKRIECGLMRLMG